MTAAPVTVPAQLRGRVVTPGDQRYRLLRSTYTTVARPAAVLLPETAEQVAAALRYARERGLPVAVRSGGHGLSGRSSNDGGVVIDMSGLHRVEVLDRRTRRVRVEAGARWANVAQALHRHGLAISSGDHGNVGVGGLATGGGVGWLVRRHGLTIDNIRAVDVVLADGTLVHADAEWEPDLFWAVRGAGAGVGVVVAFEIEALELSDVGYAQIVVEADPEGRALSQWAGVMAAAPRELSTAAMLLPYGDGMAMSITAVVAAESARRVRPAIAPLLEIGVKLLDHRGQRAPYPALVPAAHLHANAGQQPSTTTNGLLTMTGENARAIMEVAYDRRQPLVQLRSMGGAVNDVEPAATAYPHRRQDTLVIASTFPPRDGTALDAAWRPLADRVEGAYVNFESRPDRRAFDRVYPGATGERVRRLWRRYDPDGVFQPQVNGMAGR